MADLPSVGDLYGQEMQAIQGFGNQQQADLQQQYQNAMGMGMQSMAQSGLAGTSIAPSMRMGYMKQYSQALNRLNDQLTQTKLGAANTFGLGGIQVQQGQQGLDLQKQQIANQLLLGQENVGIGQQANANTLQLGLGNIGLGQQANANTLQLGLGNIALGQQANKNQLQLGMANVGLGQESNQTQRYLGQMNANTNQGYLALAQQQAAGQSQASQGYNWQPQGFQMGGGAGSYSALFGNS